MACVYKFVWDIQLDGSITNISQIKLVKEATDHDQVVWVDGQYLVACVDCSPPPICQDIAVTPTGSQLWGLPNLVPQVETNH